MVLAWGIFFGFMLFWQITFSSKTIPLQLFLYDSNPLSILLLCKTLSPAHRLPQFLQQTVSFAVSPIASSIFSRTIGVVVAIDVKRVSGPSDNRHLQPPFWRCHFASGF
jgi:hypothetical protein